MAAIWTEKYRSAGSRFTLDGTVALDASYPTGGYALPPSTFGLVVLQGSLFQNTLGYEFAYDAVNGKLQAYSAPNTEVAAAVNMSTVVVKTQVSGT